MTTTGVDRLVGKYFPYGQERPSATTDGKEKFATYFRDSETGLDYANARYHQPGMGRFMTPDPSKASTGASDPGNWNRYAYVGGDPVNFNDPHGLYACIAGYGPDGVPDWTECEDESWYVPGYDPNLGCGFVTSPDDPTWQQCFGGGGGGGGAGGDPPPAPPPQNRDLLDSAVSQALKDLMKPGCGDTIFKQGLPDPATVLQNLVDGGSYGSIKFKDLGAGTGGEESTNNIGRLFGKSRTVTITINSYNDSDPNVAYWNDGSASANAIILIHELGHAFNDLFGKGSSTIENDVSRLGKMNTGAEARNKARTDPCEK